MFFIPEKQCPSVSQQGDKVWSTLNIPESPPILIWAQILEGPDHLKPFLPLKWLPMALDSLIWNKIVDLSKREDIYDAFSSPGHRGQLQPTSPPRVVSWCPSGTCRSSRQVSEDHLQRSSNTNHSRTSGIVKFRPPPPAKESDSAVLLIPWRCAFVPPDLAGTIGNL